MSSRMRNIKVIAISPGIAIGRALRIHRHNRMQQPDCVRISAGDVEREITRLAVARKHAAEQVKALKAKLEQRVDSHEASIMDAHLMLIDDKSMVGEMERRIRENLDNAEMALTETTNHFIEVFESIGDPYFSERSNDLRDVSMRIMTNLTDPGINAPAVEDRRIITANMLTPSETAQLDIKMVLGFAVETGSATSHTAILARSMRLPAVSGLTPELLDAIRPGETIIVDGFAGRLVLDPDRRTLEAYRLRQRDAEAFMDRLATESSLRSETKDGFAVELTANIDNEQQYQEAREAGAKGVGLFRTEFLFMDPLALPGEEEQYQIYHRLLNTADGAPVTIRTFDVGADKMSAGVYRSMEVNPALGLRGIRLCLYERRDLFRSQIRALLRAGTAGDLRIMFPMVSSVSEIIAARGIIEEEKSSLTASGIEFSSDVKVGAMVETPAAALLAGHLAEHVDFFSIGTNDLVQYTMAIDRLNERVSYLDRAASPAILKLLRSCASAAAARCIPVCVCGQMAADPALALLLVGMGINELSMGAPAIPLVRRAIRAVTMYESEALVADALSCSDDDEPQKLAERLLRKRAPELFDM